MTSNQPLLPVELEMSIFDIAARSYPRFITTLMLVAWRVKLWVEPLLYRTLVVSRSAIEGHPNYPHPHSLKRGCKPTSPFQIHSESAAFLQQSVRNLYFSFDIPAEVAECILRPCSGVENLWITATSAPNTDLFRIISALPLKRLHCELTQLFYSQSQAPAQVDFALGYGYAQADLTHTMFSHLTHLELFDDPKDGLERWRGLALLPRLTHLALNNSKFLPLCPELLGTCKALKGHTCMGFGATDPRFVVIGCGEYMKDWQVGAHEGVDYWSRAEECVRLQLGYPTMQSNGE
ncbi:hypothetical protein B0H17DRAFT_1204821 [Mycena rosella]|uniref:Uncharacterized protein n=1 Tax=Mycena rosella TaxID=1033263 RepID=A0AAD7D8G2_MYCRO|nr:hypothetical protein B0H17DRAFT_1204821 [Mycena rosella]